MLQKSNTHFFFLVPSQCLALTVCFTFCVSSRTWPTNHVLDSNHLYCTNWAAPVYAPISSKVSQSETHILWNTNSKILLASERLIYAHRQMNDYIYNVCALFRFLVKKIWPTIPTPDSKFQGLFSVYGGDFQVSVGNSSHQGTVRPFLGAGLYKANVSTLTMTVLACWSWASMLLTI